MLHAAVHFILSRLRLVLRNGQEEGNENETNYIIRLCSTLHERI